MYKQVSAQYFENDVACSHKFIDSAMQYCLDVVNSEKGEIIDIKVESSTDSSYGRYGTVVIVYTASSLAAAFK